MWLLWPLCLLLSSTAGEWGARDALHRARGAGTGRGRPCSARGPRLRAWVCAEGGPGRLAGRDPARGRGGARAVLLCGPARRVLLSCVRGRSFVRRPLPGARAAARIGRSSSAAQVCWERRRGKESTLP